MTGLRLGAVANPARLDSLTGLRFFAAALIVTQHAVVLAIRIPTAYYDHAVSLFFVLSGFILAFVYPSLDGPGQVRAFYLTRLARIWPTHVAALLLSAVAVTGVTFDLKLVANFFMLHALVPRLPWYFSYAAPSWSVSDEAVFYLLFPLLIFRWDRTWWWKVIAAAGLIVALIAACHVLALPRVSTEGRVSVHGLLYVNPFARLLEFVTGIGTCSVFRWLRPRAAGVGVVAFTIAETLAFLLVGYFIARGPVPAFVMRTLGVGEWNDWVAHAGSFWMFPLLVLLLGIGRGLISAILRTRVLVALGEMSFSIYLVHQTVFGFYVKHWPVHGTPDNGGLVVCLAATTGLAFLLWRFVETPIRNAVKERLRRRRGDWTVAA